MACFVTSDEAKSARAIFSSFYCYEKHVKVYTKAGGGVGRKKEAGKGNFARIYLGRFRLTSSRGK
jgi:hypothetical protein